MHQAEEHFHILKQGKVAWNAWREKHPKTLPVLNFSNISGLDLSGYDLRQADFTQSEIRDTDFSDARLDDADLSFSEIENVDFSRARFTGASMGSCSIKASSFKDAMVLSALFSDNTCEIVDFRGAIGLLSAWSNSTFKRCKFAKATFTDSDFRSVDLSGCNLRGASLRGADFTQATLAKAKLQGAYLEDACFDRANLVGVRLEKAILINANLKDANLENVNLEEADLSHADLHKANLKGAKLNRSLVHGVAAWNIQLDAKTEQSELCISDEGEPDLTVDDIEVAQFVYLLANNEKIRTLLGTVTNKAVLILGRFTPERKAILDLLRTELRKRNYVPIVFDFEKATTKDFTETIKVLAGLCVFIVADITQPKSSPLELQATVPDYMTPFVPIIQENEEPFSMFTDLKQKYNWVLEPLKYPSELVLKKAIDKGIIQRAMAKHAVLLERKAKQISVVSAEDYLSE